MTELAIVDTDVLIDVGRNVEEAIASLEQIEERSIPTISVVTQMELLVGCQNKAELRKLERFLRRFHVVKLNESISDTAVELLRHYRLSHGLLIADALIAATALSPEKPRHGMRRLASFRASRRGPTPARASQGSPQAS